MNLGCFCTLPPKKSWDIFGNYWNMRNFLVIKIYLEKIHIYHINYCFFIYLGNIKTKQQNTNFIKFQTLVMYFFRQLSKHKFFKIIIPHFLDFGNLSVTSLIGVSNHIDLFGSGP